VTATPAAGAKDQVARLLTLVPYLRARGEVRLDEAAVALGVSAEQLLKDLKVLWMCGTPGGMPDDLIDVDVAALEGPEDGDGIRTDGIIRVSNADYLAKPLRLTTTEATALIVALRALRSGAGDDTREVVDRALAKLEAAAAEGAEAARVDPGSDAADTEQALLATRLQGAADHQRQVRLSYYVPSRDEQSERVVDPRGVVTAQGQAQGQGHLYLDAWCHSAEAPRLFRLDRIDHAQVLDDPVETPQEGPRDLGDGIFSQSTDVTPVTLLLEPEARWMTSYYPVEEIREVGQDRMEVVLLVADERWLTRLMLRLAPHARVLSPPAYADTFMAAAQRALSLYA
jgi:proteasome accessory factor C